jgi:hypothetical protein
MATSPNFGWLEPDNTDLVKNGALAIRTAVDAIDSSLVDLKGGTTGQVLAKASNTDMDFVWAADAGAPTSYGYSAGKNKIINGDFSVWQRGTSFSGYAGSTYNYTADRWVAYSYASSTLTVSQQSFTAGTAPVAGYEGQYFMRVNSTNTGNFFGQRIEDVRTFAGQTVTLSYWAKAQSAQTLYFVRGVQYFGTGGSTVVETTVSTNPSLTTSWQRFTHTITLPSISGKTIGAGNYLSIEWYGDTPSNYIDIWGVQLEAGSTATSFQTATGTLQGELAACQRYYWRSSGGTYAGIGSGMATTTTTAKISIPLPVAMRVVPTAIDYSNVGITDQITATQAATLSIIAANGSLVNPIINADFASAFAAAKPVDLTNNNNTAGYVGLSAEL